MLDPMGYTDVMPFYMSYNGEGGFYAYAGSQYNATYIPIKAFGKVAWAYYAGPWYRPSSATGWYSLSPGSGNYKSDWLRLDMPSPKEIRCVQMIQSNVVNTTYKVSHYSIQYSDDASYYQDVPGHSYQPFPLDWRMNKFTFSSVGAHRYWRVYLWNYNTISIAVGLAMLRFYEKDPEVGIIKLKGTFQNSGYAGGGQSSNVYNMPNGGQLITSSVTYPSGALYWMQYLFDDVDNILVTTSNTYWLSAAFTAPGYMTFNFSNVAFDVLRYVDIYPNGRTDHKSKFDVYYSADNVNWTYAGTSSYTGIAGDFHRININAYRPLGAYVQLRVYKIGGLYMCLNGIHFYVQKYTRRFLVQDQYDNKVYTVDGNTSLGIIPTISEDTFLNSGSTSITNINYSFIKSLKKPIIRYYKR